MFLLLLLISDLYGSQFVCFLSRVLLPIHFIYLASEADSIDTILLYVFALLKLVYFLQNTDDSYTLKYIYSVQTIAFYYEVGLDDLLIWE